MADQIYCPVRQSWVKRLPEEVVRQNLISEMVKELQYPISHFALEVSLTSLPHLTSYQPDQLPKRRADLIVFSKNPNSSHSLYPLLLIECKAVPINSKSFRQVIGYNQFVKAHFIALVNQTNRYTGYFSLETQEYDFFEGIPSYHFLKNLL